MGLLHLRNQVLSSLNQGKSREDIFHSLVKDRPGDTAKIAFAIASVPGAELQKKYFLPNVLLLLALLGVGVSNFFMEFPISQEKSILFTSLRIVIPLVLAYFVYLFHGGIYRILGFWCFFDLVELLVVAEFGGAAAIAKLFSLLIALAIAILLSVRVFPNLRFLGPKQDNLGRYLL